MRPYLVINPRTRLSFFDYYRDQQNKCDQCYNQYDIDGIVIDNSTILEIYEYIQMRQHANSKETITKEEIYYYFQNSVLLSKSLIDIDRALSCLINSRWITEINSSSQILQIPSLFWDITSAIIDPEDLCQDLVNESISTQKQFEFEFSTAPKKKFVGGIKSHDQDFEDEDEDEDGNKDDDDEESDVDGDGDDDAQAENDKFPYLKYNSKYLFTEAERIFKYIIEYIHIYRRKNFKKNGKNEKKKKNNPKENTFEIENENFIQTKYQILQSHLEFNYSKFTIDFCLNYLKFIHHIL